MQIYKVATSEEEPAKVLKWLRDSSSYKSHNFYLNDLDMTCDYSGSFDKKAVIGNLLYVEDFRMQGSDDQGSRTVVDNDLTVGANCLTWMEEVWIIINGPAASQRLPLVWMYNVPCLFCRLTTSLAGQRSTTSWRRPSSRVRCAATWETTCWHGRSRRTRTWPKFATSAPIAVGHL